MKNEGISIFTFFPISFPSFNCVNSIIKLSMIITFRFCPVTVIPRVFNSHLKDFKAYLWFLYSWSPSFLLLQWNFSFCHCLAATFSSISLSCHSPTPHPRKGTEISDLFHTWQFLFVVFTIFVRCWTSQLGIIFIGLYFLSIRII